MRTLRNELAALLVAGAAITALPMAGCYPAERAIIVDSPPEPREEVVVARPGFVWVHGHWLRDRDRWAWRGGHYERERPGMVYVEGRWERRGRGQVWVDGGWRARGSVTIR